MGSLTSRPKIPKQTQPQVVYVPAPVAPPPAAYVPPPQAAQPQEPSAEERVGQARKNNLLTRERGRFGTVATSFRGLLGLAASGGQGKTLLGE